jgi:hypothetical protein
MIYLYLKAKTINENNSYIYVYLSTIYNDKIKSNQFLDKAIELNDKNGAIYNNLGFMAIEEELPCDKLFEKACKYGCITSLYNRASFCEMDD